ncbi:Sensor histidine kinase DesK [Clavibacter michiganensis]|uniref:histidine kinase n=1 Tax=Clavibacter michiganensis TaxID=28447 RepID=A0A251YV42_9MICO|nr:histidine kinase [Clavibacter michiganensis]OUE28116.1 Sensor histidine kinase DesK [Clavibacter michiganensis]
MTRSPARRAPGALPRLVRVGYGVALGGLLLLDAAVSGSLGQCLYLVAVVALAALVARGRVPAWTVGAVSGAATIVTVLLAASGVAAPFALSEGLVLLVAIVATTRRAVGARGAAAVALVAVATATLPIRLLSADTATFVILLVAVVACALAVGATLRNADAERRLALAVATQRERDGLARDLHDDFTNRVTGMILLAQAARRRVDAPGTELDAELARMEESGGAALASMRRWVRTLRDTGVERDPELADSADDADGPDDAIRAMLDGWEASAPGRRAELQDTTAGPLPAAVRATATRIVQESVTNATRHAPAADRIRVTLADDAAADAVVVTVVSPLDDAGRSGADPVPGSPGLGLVGMRERAAILGGRLDAGPVAGTWTVRAVLPRDAGA